MDSRFLFGLGMSALTTFLRYLFPSLPKALSWSGATIALGLIVMSFIPSLKPLPAIMMLLGAALFVGGLAITVSVGKINGGIIHIDKAINQDDIDHLPSKDLHQKHGSLDESNLAISPQNTSTNTPTPVPATLMEKETVFLECEMTDIPRFFEEPTDIYIPEVVEKRVGFGKLHVPVTSQDKPVDWPFSSPLSLKCKAKSFSKDVLFDLSVKFDLIARPMVQIDAGRSTSGEIIAHEIATINIPKLESGDSQTFYIQNQGDNFFTAQLIGASSLTPDQKRKDIFLRTNLPFNQLTIMPRVKGNRQ